MTAPSFLNTGFAFTTLPGTTVDVQDIINAVATMLTSTLSAAATAVYPSGERWTSLGGGVYKSPVDAGGRFMTITMIRTTAVRLQFSVADPVGVIQQGEIDIFAAGSLVEIFGGPGHLVISANNNGTWETARAFLADPTPEPLGAFGVYVYCSAHRRASDGAPLANGAVFTSWHYRFYGGTIVGVSANPNPNFAVPLMPLVDTANVHLRTQAGSDIAAPYGFAVASAAFTDSFLGGRNAYQVVVIDSSFAAGSDVSVPIDTGVLGVFRVSRMTAGGARQYAIRKG